MVGRRRESGRPTAMQSRQGRQRAMFTARMARASTPSERVGVAAGFMRAVLVRAAATSPAAAERVAAQVVAQLLAGVDELYREEQAHDQRARVRRPGAARAAGCGTQPPAEVRETER
jgi:hypothetical protein